MDYEADLGRTYGGQSRRVPTIPLFFSKLDQKPGRKPGRLVAGSSVTISSRSAKPGRLVVAFEPTAWPHSRRRGTADS